MLKNTYVISLGGSLVVPSGGIDWKLLKEFRKLILKETSKGRKFFIIVGGGATCRKYNEAARRAAKVKRIDLDWLGIEVTRLNAQLLLTIFSGLTYPKIAKDPNEVIKTKKKIIIAGGWKPGSSSDIMAVALAKKYKIKTLINLSNVDYVYTCDPRKYKSAKPIKKLNWQSLKKIIGNKWGPGLHAPFDPVASRLAQKLGLEVIIMNGKKLDNLGKCLDGKKFKGTVIEN